MSAIKIILIDPINNYIKTLLIDDSLSILDIKELIISTFDYRNDTLFIGLQENVYPFIIYPFSSLAKPTLLSSLDSKKFNILIKENASVIFDESHMRDTKNNILENAEDHSHEMAEAAFYYLDLNADGKIDRLEMVQALKVALSCLDDESVEINTLSKAITESCYNYVGMEDEFYISEADFKEWYFAKGDDELRDYLVKGIEAYHHKIVESHDVDDYTMQLTNNSISFYGFNQFCDRVQILKTILGFSHVSIKSLFDAFKSEHPHILQQLHTDINDKKVPQLYQISKSSYLNRLLSLAAVAGSSIKKSDFEEGINVELTLVSIFDSLLTKINYDSNNDSVEISLQALLCGLTLFYSCHPGSPVVDSLLDTAASQHNERITYEESLRQLFRIVYDIKEDDSRVFASDRVLRQFLYENVKLVNLLTSIIFGSNNKFLKSMQTSVENFTVSIFSKVTKNCQHENYGYWNSFEFVKACVFGVKLIFATINGDEQSLDNNVLSSKQFDKEKSGFSSVESFHEALISPLIFTGEEISVSLFDGKSVLGLVYISPLTIFQLFKLENLDYEGNINSTSYHHVLHKLLRRHYTNLSVIDRFYADYIIDRVLDIFNQNKDTVDQESSDKKCDVLDVTMAYITLCGGSSYEKSKCVSELFRYFGDSSFNEEINDDENDDTSPDKPHSHIALEYVALCTEPIFITISALNSKVLIENLDIIEDLSYELVVFAINGLFKCGNIGQITIEQFELWFDVLYEFFDHRHGQDLLQKIIDLRFTSNSYDSILDTEEDEINLNAAEDVVIKIKSTLSELFAVKCQILNSEFLGDSLSLIVPSDNANTNKIDASNDKPINDTLNSNGIELPTSTSTLLVELRDVSKLLGLDSFSAEEIMEILSEHSDKGKISQSQWLKVVNYGLILSGVSNDKFAQAEEYARDIFMAFYNDPYNSKNVSSVQGEELVEFVNLASGLILLSSSPIEDKITVGFALYNISNRGSTIKGSKDMITASQFESLIYSSLLIIITCSNVANMKLQSIPNISIKTLSEAVLAECLITLKLNKTSLLSLDMLCEVANDCIVIAENVAI